MYVSLFQKVRAKSPETSMMMGTFDTRKVENKQSNSNREKRKLPMWKSLGRTYCKTAIILFVFELGHLSHDVWHMISIQTKSESGAGSNCHIRALLMMILDLGDVGESENPGGVGVVMWWAKSAPKIHWISRLKSQAWIATFFLLVSLFRLQWV